jgi:hypothetical protein
MKKSNNYGVFLLEKSANFFGICSSNAINPGTDFTGL